MIILASASPRRRELLEQIGINYKVLVKNTKEETSAKTPRELALINARLKAVAAQSESKYPTLAADTVVTLNGKIYGKPKNKDDAFNMLKTLKNRSHEVITGIVLIKDDQVYEKAARTKVTFGEMTDKEILEYIDTKEPMDKAGAYALQGIGAKFIKSIEGSPSNVIGLPLYELRELFKEAGLGRITKQKEF